MPFIILSREGDTVRLVSESPFERQEDAVEEISSALAVGTLERGNGFLLLDMDRAVPVAVVEVSQSPSLSFEEPVAEIAEEPVTASSLEVEAPSEEMAPDALVADPMAPDAALEPADEEVFSLEEVVVLEEVDVLDLVAESAPEPESEPPAEEVANADAQPFAAEEAETTAESLVEETVGIQEESALGEVAGIEEEPVEVDAVEIEEFAEIDVPVVELPEVGLPDLPPDEAEELESTIANAETGETEDEPAEDVTVSPDVTTAALDELLGEARVEVDLEEVDEDVLEDVRDLDEPADEVVAALLEEIPPVEGNPDAPLAWPWHAEDEAKEEAEEEAGDLVAESDFDSVAASDDAEREDEQPDLADMPEEVVAELEPAAADEVAEDELADGEPADDEAAVAEAEVIVAAEAVVAAIEEDDGCLPDVPGYEAGDCDLSTLTCKDCVYVNTCPNQEERTPATCGSFQWTSV